MEKHAHSPSPHVTEKMPKRDRNLWTLEGREPTRAESQEGVCMEALGQKWGAGGEKEEKKEEERKRRGGRRRRGREAKEEREEERKKLNSKM